MLPNDATKCFIAEFDVNLQQVDERNEPLRWEIKKLRNLHHVYHLTPIDGSNPTISLSFSETHTAPRQDHQKLVKAISIYVDSEGSASVYHISKHRPRR